MGLGEIQQRRRNREGEERRWVGQRAGAGWSRAWEKLEGKCLCCWSLCQHLRAAGPSHVGLMAVRLEGGYSLQSRFHTRAATRQVWKETPNTTLRWQTVIHCTARAPGIPGCFNKSWNQSSCEFHCYVALCIFYVKCVCLLDVHIYNKPLFWKYLLPFFFFFFFLKKGSNKG